MGTPHGHGHGHGHDPEAFATEYDVLADVSQHGASVFDFLSLAAPPSAGHSPLGAPSTSPHGTTGLSLGHAIGDHYTIAMDVASDSTMLTPSPPAPPKGVGDNRSLPLAESFCTTDSAPRAVAVRNNAAITKPRRRTSPVSRAAAAAAAGGALLVDASTEAGGSVHSPSAGDDAEPGKDVHNSHTRRCRAKVNSKFQELLRILPTPPPKTGVKHKAQILDYTIRVFREIYAKKLYLEAELALSSRSHLNSWVDGVVKPATRLADILNPYMSLICTKEKWAFAETWVPVVRPERPQHPGARIATEGTSEDVGATIHVHTGAATASLQPPPPIPDAPLRVGTTVIHSSGNLDDPDLQGKLERFRDRSRAFVCKPRVDPPGRILCTMRPEWLPSLSDEEAFQRAALAQEASLTVCFGVPFFVRGHVAAVVVFYDMEQRPYDAKCVDLAGTIAGLLGNAFGARSEDTKPE